MFSCIFVGLGVFSSSLNGQWGSREVPYNALVLHFGGWGNFAIQD